MEPLTTAITAITTVFFSKALEKTGETFGEGVSDKIAQLMKVIYEKFKASGTEGLLTRAEKQPTKRNIEIVKVELEMQMYDDEAFATQLIDLIQELQQSANPSANIMQKAGDAYQVNQVILGDVEIGGDIKLGNLTQES